MLHRQRTFDAWSLVLYNILENLYEFLNFHFDRNGL